MFTTHRPDIIRDKELNEDIPAFPASISASSLIILNMHEMNRGPHHPQAPIRLYFLSWAECLIHVNVYVINRLNLINFDMYAK